MSIPLSPAIALHLHRFSVDEYRRASAAGLFVDKRVELLNGLVVDKMPQNPPHSSIIHTLQDILPLLLPAGWCVRLQLPITLANSEPEPDGCVARGSRQHDRSRHPGPADVRLLIEVSDTTLDKDRVDKLALYAEANIPEYWIVNLVDRHVEVYTQPSGPTSNPGYTQCQVHAPGTVVPVVFAGTLVGGIAVDDLLPERAMFA